MADYSEVVQTAREYYNSNDADNFYFTIWGGEDIHIGWYKSEEESIADASERTVATMASKLGNLGPDARVLDLGGGYGGACRWLAKKFGCSSVCLNLSEVENERDRKMNEEQGLAQKVDVVDGSFEDVPYDDATFDVVWSQDAILHSGDRDKVVAEAARVLKPGGQLIFTDICEIEGVDKDKLQPIYDRIHLSSLGLRRFYVEAAKKYGLELVETDMHTEHLITHYGRVLRETEAREQEIGQVVSQDYIDRMKKGLQHWVNGGKSGHIEWGIFHFRKPA